MTRLLFLVEGQTEDLFVRDVITPHLAQYSVFVSKPKIIVTKENPRGANYTGGMVTMAKTIPQLKSLLSGGDFVTTFFDFYGCAWGTGNESIDDLENKLFVELDQNYRFIPYIQRHEFEALLFSDPAEIVKVTRQPEKLNSLLDVRVQFSNPEDINNGRETCPSRRIITATESVFNKVLHGSSIAQNIGITLLKESCPRFSDWLSRLEQLPNINNV